MAPAMVRAGVWHDLTKTISHGHNTTYVQRKCYTLHANAFAKTFVAPLRDDRGVVFQAKADVAVWLHRMLPKQSVSDPVV